MTERGFARAVQASLPHVHNMLAGKRGISTEMADVLLAYLRMSTYDLLEHGRKQGGGLQQATALMHISRTDVGGQIGRARPTDYQSRTANY
jgi:hypothetical protein